MLALGVFVVCTSRFGRRDFDMDRALFEHAKIAGHDETPRQKLDP